MKIVVTGALGMLGQELMPVLRAQGHEAVGLDRQDCDLTDWAAVRARLRAERPEAVIHCAAYTDVDGSEAKPEAAFAVNSAGTQHVALVCQELDVPMLYVSTDYVFDGLLGRPYVEADRTNPQGVYGLSKLAGEQAVQQLLKRFYIVRTSWLYGRHGKNFVETMRRLGREKSELAVVADQFGCPTWTLPLAETITHLIGSGRYGVYHATGQGVTSWHGFTEAIMRLDGLDTPVRPISTEELGRPAPRPAYSPLRNLNLELAGYPLMPAWEESLRAYLASVPYQAPVQA